MDPSFNLISFYLDDFLPSVPGSCSDDNTFGSYKVLAKAEIACAFDQTCIGILDQDCDSMGDYRLCKQGFVNPSDSCIHQKRVIIGNNYTFCQ